MKAIAHHARDWIAQRPLARSLTGVLVFCVVITGFGVRAAATAEQVLASAQAVSPQHIAASFVLIVVCFVWAALAWWASLWLLGGRLAAGAALQIYFLSLLPRYLPGLIWGYVGRTYLCEQRGVVRSVAVLSSAVEIALFVLSGLSIGLVRWLAPPASLCLICLALMALAAGLTLLTPPASRSDSLGFARMILAWCVLGAAYFLFWILYGLSISILAQAASPTLTAQQIAYVIAAFAMSWLVGFAAVFVPGGLGVREAGIILALEPLTGSLMAIYIAALSRALNLAADASLFIVALWRKSLVITS
jgi:hypothetical protein